jgi:putative aldouronate transport system substrate-binding protein
MKRTLLSFIVIMFISSIVLAACSKNQEPESPKESSDVNQEQAEDPASFDPLGKYETPVTITQVLSYRPPEEQDALKGVTPETNAYLKDLKEMMNIDLKYLWSVPMDQYAEKFSLSIASGDLPDMMMVDQATFLNFVRQGLVADLSEVYENYASPTLKRVIESDGGLALQATTVDGKVMGLTTSFQSAVQLAYIRADWLKNLNLPVPKTMEEFEAVAEAFVKNDPDMNGENDTYGFAMNKNFLVGAWAFDARGIFYSHQSYPGGWIKGQDGTLLPGEIQPGTKEALTRLQDWYKRGIIDREFALKDENKVSEDIVAGRVGITLGEWWVPNWPLNLSKDNNPNAEWIAVPLPEVGGESAKTLISPTLNAIMVVNKKYKQPEAAVKLANYYLEMRKPKYIDKSSPDYKGADSGYIYNWFEPRFIYPNYLDDAFIAVNEALDKGQTDIQIPEDFLAAGEAAQFFNESKKYMDNKKDNAAWGFYYSRVAKEGGFGLSKKALDDKQFIQNEFYGTQTPTQLERGGSLNKLMAETFTKIVMGEDIDQFDKFVESWKTLGGNDITDEVNEWYKGK